MTYLEPLTYNQPQPPECRFSGAMDFSDGASSSVEYTYDANGNMTSDANKGIDAVTYNRLHRPESVQTGGDTFGFVYDAAGNLLQRTHYHPMGTLNPLGGLMQLTSGLDPGAPTLQSMTDTVSYCGPFEYSGGSLSRVNFPGGYVSGGVAYHYIHDHQGNVRQVVDATTGKVFQENHYYPGGMLFAESTATYFKPGSADNAYRYGGKELLTAGGLNLSLHGARMYEPALLRFITPDPLRHETPHLSSYLYCAANPVMLTDPTGLSTRVRKLGNGTYEVVGGALDGDLGIYLCGGTISETGTLIGKTPVETSFYNSDIDGEEKWMIGAIIDPNDDSGINFVNAIVNDTPGNIGYACNAYGGKLYDFKRSNGTSTKNDDYSDTKSFYRGMPIQKCKPPMLPIYSSARDIGNMMAGYVTGYNGMPWRTVRFFFDLLQSYQKGRRATEGISSQNAQHFGHSWGLSKIRKEMKHQASGVFPYNFIFKQ